MLFQPFVFVAAAAALVIIPKISEHDENIFKALPVGPNPASSLQIPASALSQSVSVPCRECRGRKTQLQLGFSIEDGSRLVVNGFELYPNAEPFRADIVAPMLNAKEEGVSMKLGYNLAISSQPTSDEDHLKLIDVHFRIIEVGDRFVDKVPSIHIQLVKAPSEELLIGKLDMKKGSHKKPCKTLACRIKDKFEGLWGGTAAIKGCGRKHRGQFDSQRHHSDKNGESLQHPDTDLKQSHHRPKPNSNHGFHTHHHIGARHQHWLQLMKNIASHIFLPVLMGITAGIGVACFAMFIATITSRIVSVVSGLRQQSCLQHYAAANGDFAFCDEKAALIPADHKS